MNENTEAFILRQATQPAEPPAGAAELSHAEFKDMLQKLGDGPQTQGGTPESVDELLYLLRSEPPISAMPHIIRKARALQTSLADAQAEVEALRKERAELGDVLEKWFPDITSPHAFPIRRAIYLLRLHKLAKKDEDALRAELEQTRREAAGWREDSDKMLLKLNKAEADLDRARQALTESDRADMRTLAQEVRKLTAQRDTAIRERDEAKARLQRANDLGCLLVMNGKWTEAEWAEHQRITGTAHAALAAKTTEGGERP